MRKSCTTICEGYQYCTVHNHWTSVEQCTPELVLYSFPNIELVLNSFPNIELVLYSFPNIELVLYSFPNIELVLYSAYNHWLLNQCSTAYNI